MIKTDYRNFVQKKSDLDYIEDIETGAYNSFTVTNNITETFTATMSTVRSGT